MMHLVNTPEEPLQVQTLPSVTSSADSTARGRRAKGGKGAISCAECRRLKIRCDLTKVPRAPCSSCEKRGCGEICPEGALQTGKGSRYILSNTAELHRTIDDLRKRIAELEDALAVSHAANSPTQHALLQPDKMKIGFVQANLDADGAEEQDDSKHNLDTLMIADNGRAQWLGTSASSEWFVDIDDVRPVPRLPYSRDPRYRGMGMNKDFVAVDPEFLTEERRQDFRAQLLSNLPTHTELVYLVDTYYAQAAWFYNPVPRQILDKIVSALYSGSDEAIKGVYNQELSTVYSILAMAELMSDKNPPYSQLQKRYAYHAKLAITLDCVYVHAGLETIEAMLLRALYMLLNNDPGSPQKVWGNLGLITKLAMSIGLHRDPSHFDLGEEECTRRRRVWWECVAMDAWQSISFGRPNAINRRIYDTKIPYSDPAEQAGEEHRFQKWKYTFVSTILLDIIETCVSIGATPTVAAVLKLDQRVRDYIVPVSLPLPPGEDRTQPLEATIFQRNIMFCVRETTIMLLNRTLFIYALHEDIKDPLCSKFAGSVLSVHASASALLERGRTLLAFQSQAPRFWIWWSQAFTATVSLAAICVKAPGCTLAPSALEEMDVALEVFQRASSGYKARRLLSAVQTLHTRAHAEMDAYRQGHWVRTHDQSYILPGVISRPATLISNTQRLGPTHNALVSRESNENSMELDAEKVPNSSSEKEASMESAINDYLHNLGKQISRAQQPPRKSASPPNLANGSGHARQLPVQANRAQGSGPLRHGFPTSDSRGIDSQPPPPSWAASKSTPLYSGLYGNDTSQTNVPSPKNQWLDYSSQATNMAYLPTVSDASPAFPQPPVSDQMLILTSDDATWNEFMRGLGLGAPGA